MLHELLAHDDWLPEALAQPHPQRYTQYLLYTDIAERFSVVAFVWGPGQSTPIHDHRVWGLLGVLRGAERAQAYERSGQRYARRGDSVLLQAGQIDVVSPTVGDIHQVSNAFADRASVSIHVYGGNVSALSRSVYTEDGSEKAFVSAYANDVLPNIWDRSSERSAPVAAVASTAIRSSTYADVRAALLGHTEIALLDVREEDPFAVAHPLFAANLPFGRIELDVFGRIPRRSTRIVVYDNHEEDGLPLAEPAVRRLIGLGYTDVSLLEGGLAGWRAAGGEVFKDVNVPSKAFGELVDATRHTPSLPAQEVQALIDAKADLVVLDARPFEEYTTMNIPTGVSVPGAELALRVRALAPDPSTQVVVNCAGRTRSIIGAQSLINAGVPNPVAALRNGTIGWTLAGQKLEHGQTRRFADLPQASEVSPSVTAEVAARARALALKAGASFVSLRDVERMRADSSRTTYIFDVRTPEEYEAGHIAGARSAPGGQLVQETDVYAPVRGAHVVVTDTDGVRAAMTASWLAQMNVEVHVLEGVGREALTRKGRWRPPVPDLFESVAAPSIVEPHRLRTWLDHGDVLVLDVGTSARFVKQHVPGAWWVLRSQLAQALPELPKGPQYVVVADDEALASLTAADLAALVRSEVHVLRGGLAAWREAGFATEAGGAQLASPRIDRYRRPYEGTDNPVAAMQGYLDWEFGLVDQLARDGTHGFKVL